jgi:hypothetical protein
VTPAPEDHERHQVDDEAARRDGEHAGARHRGRCAQALHRLEQDHGCDRQQRGAVHERGQDLGAVVAEGEARARGPVGDPEREEGERQGADVPEHVAGVGEERQRAGEHAARHLGEHVDGRQGQGDLQAPLVGAAGGCLMGVGHRVSAPLDDRTRGARRGV